MVLRFRPKPKRHPQDILARKGVSEDGIKERGVGGPSGKSGRKPGFTLALQYMQKGLGRRTSGAGGHDVLTVQKDKIKAWAHDERAHGHSLNQGGL
jgi:hypothetical protein